MFVLRVSADMNNSQAEYTVFHFPQSRLILTAQEDKIIKWCWDLGMFTRHTHTNAFSDMIHEHIPRIAEPKKHNSDKNKCFGGLIVMRLYCVFGIVNSAVFICFLCLWHQPSETWHYFSPPLFLVLMKWFLSHFP